MSLYHPAPTFQKKLPEKIIKADVVGNYIDRDLEETGIGGLLKDAFSMLTTKKDDIEKVARKLIKYHRPWDTAVYLKRLGIAWAEKLLN